ncbi:SMI1/KNR4 family protein [Bacillus atrophaeus]|uniref:SMI1/KNR4 family protein n=1 Tax=Bacillus atrophaeus TaxID=1452 RepID=UPI0022810989|nr:SMI1/KNR4 family protein [Bacillus atrophaeus]MCY8959219.1 SMI1/KNR4 family protein [Bacillus atrophaeus]MCY8964794.1 SMI1/KNR4 family protein [Bacillus atrophaeus]MCY9436467.1 SMI1/KNR4 family protein [Bacillus atrophaeus]MEC0649413.1 SMI1/KNR4 family protein [Bacillus atrophaeus]
MNMKENSIINPLPTDELLDEKERKWRITLPQSYKIFIKQNSGGIPLESQFLCNGHNYAIDRFLCILKVTGENELEWYDIGATMSQLDERIIDDEDLVGVEILPIAVLFAGDFICLDYRSNKDEPSVCVWSHEESGEFAPVTYQVANNFAEFLEMLGE